MPRFEIEHVEPSEDLAESSTECFDRVAYAERLVALVRPPRTTVAICEGSRRVHVETGRQWGSSPSEEAARWAIVSVPHTASRRAIARGVLGLYGGGRGAVRAWALNVVMAEIGGGEALERSVDEVAE